MPDRLATYQHYGHLVLLNSVAGSPSSAPRLEFFRHGVKELQRVTIDRCPFSIGRSETCDLQIDSVEVSREHAQISRRGGIWVIRDLGSTNGTKVNGKSVRESFLSDGDILAIAETEVTFVAASVTPIQRMATQRIQPRESIKLPAALAQEISQIRALTEALLWQNIPIQWTKAIEISSGDVEACFANCSESLGHADPELIAHHAVSKYVRQLTLWRAIETTQADSTAKRIFLPVDCVEMKSPRPWITRIEELRFEMPRELELGIAIGLPQTVEIPILDNFCREVRRSEMLLAFLGFQGSDRQIVQFARCAPDYLVLADAMLGGVLSSSQPPRRLESVLMACDQLGITAVLAPCACERTIARCQQIGYEFALQSTTPNVQGVRRKVLAVTS